MEEVSWKGNQASIRDIRGLKSSGAKDLYCNKIVSKKHLNFQNKRARLNDFEDYGHEMRDNYEVDTFEEDMLK